MWLDREVIETDKELDLRFPFDGCRQWVLAFLAAGSGVAVLMGLVEAMCWLYSSL